MRRNFIALATLLAACLVAPSYSAAADDDVDSLALELIDRFYDDLGPDDDALAAYLGDGFQIIGSDGLRFDRETYLTFPKSITKYKISDLVAFREADVLTATFRVEYVGTFVGVAREVPRLSRMAVFHETADGWKIQALAALGTGENAIDDVAASVVTRWRAATASGDKAEILKLASPDYQFQHADGSGATLEEYVKNLPPPTDPTVVEDLVASSFSNTLVTRYSVRKGKEGDRGVPASPRMTVFQRIDGEWRAAADAVFAPIE